jgi:DNA-binding MarR family transcriptional regulator
MAKVLYKRLKQTTKFNSVTTEASLNLLIAAYSVRTMMDGTCSKFGITSPQYNVLRILKGKYPDGYPRCEIIQRMIEPAPDVTRIIDRLTKERLVERFQSNEDRRHSISRITQKGLKLLDDILPHLQESEKRLSKMLTKTELNELSRICEKIYDAEN